MCCRLPHGRGRFCLAGGCTLSPSRAPAPPGDGQLLVAWGTRQGKPLRQQQGQGGCRRPDAAHRLPAAFLPTSRVCSATECTPFLYRWVNRGRELLSGLLEIAEPVTDTAGHGAAGLRAPRLMFFSTNPISNKGDARHPKESHVTTSTACGYLPGPLSGLPRQRTNTYLETHKQICKHGPVRAEAASGPARSHRQAGRRKDRDEGPGRDGP